MIGARMKLSIAVKKASDFFSGGLYCSQAILGAFCENYGVGADLAFKISCGLNSGCRRADICGAVSGAVLVIGLKYGDNKAVCNAKTEDFIKTFTENNGDIICRGLLNCDISTPEGIEKARAEDLFRTRCLDLVISAAHILDESGY
jgi:C_GCAxxG_C_C family probable redox protein